MARRSSAAAPAGSLSGRVASVLVQPGQAVALLLPTDGVAFLA